jgi:hypothetical protein
MLAQIAIDLGRPRDQIKTKATRQFVDRRSEIAELIKRAGSQAGDNSVEH